MRNSRCIQAALPVIQFFTDLAASGRAEIRWHTTWQYDALHLGERLGLREKARLQS